MSIGKQTCYYDERRSVLRRFVMLDTMEDLDPIEKTVSFQDAPGRLGDLLQGVSDKGDHYVVEHDGVPLAVVVPFALYPQWKRRRKGFFDRIRETADRAGLSETEATRLTDEAKRAIRSQPCSGLRSS